MFVRTKPIGSTSRKRVQICECHREGAKVKQKVIKHVGIANNDTQLDELKKLAYALMDKMEQDQKGPFLFDLALRESKPLPAPTQPPAKSLVNISAIKEEKRVVDGFHDVFGTLFDQLGFHRILKGTYKDTLRDVVLARIAYPASKSETQHVLSADFGREINLDVIYRMMDALAAEKESAQKTVFLATQQLCFGKVDVVLFDVTTLYFESFLEDELRTFGYSKDQKFHSIQVVLALATASNGLPIGYQLFPGNTAEVSTLLASIDTWKKSFPIGKVRFVADRALMSEKNLQALEAQGIEYVVAAKLRKLPQPLREEILQMPKTITSPVLDRTIEGSQRRLIVTYCPQRHAKDEKDRARILEKMSKKIGKGKNAKKLVSNAGYQKYLSVEGESILKLDDEKISQDAAWDGFHGIITNCPEAAADLLSHYRRLWVIEESFRIHKHNLSIRPIYHFKPERIEAHILICYMAFALMRHMEVRVGIQKEKISMREMRDELWRVQSSYLKDTETDKRYRMPSQASPKAKKLYQVLGIKRTHSVSEM